MPAVEGSRRRICVRHTETRRREIPMDVDLLFMFDFVDL